MSDLETHRKKIDNIDDEILRLLNERAKHVIAVGEIKKLEGSALWVPSREEAIYARLTKLNEGKVFPTDAIRPVFREIISASLSLEAHQKVGYLGPLGTFTNLAALKHFGLSAKLIPVRSIPDVFEGVGKGRFNYGVIPIENSIEGVVNHTLDMLMDNNITIMGEIYVEISHHLLSRTGDSKDIKAIYSHPHAVAQCRNFLSKNLPDIPVYETDSTAKAASMAKDDETIAAISSSAAEVIYNLKVVEKSIEDSVNNFTRFLIIGKSKLAETGNDKTSLIFSLPHTSGALYQALEVFEKGNINMTKIESRPSKSVLWEYLFYSDIEGHLDNKHIKEILSKFKEKVSIIKLLGSYPKGER